ncbi:MAG: PQQ-binding-like beta-propeller repeat protein [Bacillota bacterium]
MPQRADTGTDGSNPDGRKDTRLPCVSPSEPDLRLAWISLALLTLFLVVLAAYPLGDVEGGVGIDGFMRIHQYVLLVAVPAGLGLAVGFLMSIYLRRDSRWRFLWSAFILFLVQLSILGRFVYFMPFYVWCSGFLPNPAAWGITFASAGIATFTSAKIDRMLEESASRKSLSQLVAGASAVIMLGSSAVLAPVFHIEWRRAPTILDDRWEITWEIMVPAPKQRHGSGFWFAARQTGPLGLHPVSTFTEPQRVSESDEAVFLTDRWIGLIRLSDGKILWGREFSFEVIGDRVDAMSVYVVEDCVHVIVRNPSGDIHAFRKSDGELIWEAKNLGFKTGPIGDLRVGAVPGPNFILATYADGRPGYMVVDSKTGSVTEHALPVPDGMRVPTVEIGSSKYTLGPAVLEGDAGALAIAAYYSKTETVHDFWGFGYPFPEKGYLFGIDPLTGRIAWQVEDVGNWREDLRWPLQHIWFDNSTIVWTGGYDSHLIRVWDTATGSLRWSKSFQGGVSRVCVNREGIAVGEPQQEVTLLDLQTGEVRWPYNAGAAGVDTMFFLGDACVLGTSANSKSLLVFRVSDGSLTFNLSGISDYRIRGIQDGDLIVQFTSAQGSGVIRVDPETGEQGSYGSDEIKGSWELATERYLLSRREGESSSAGVRQDLFKAEGALQLMNRYVYPVQTYGSLGEVTAEGGILVTSYDAKGLAYRVYLLRPAGRGH